MNNSEVAQAGYSTSSMATARTERLPHGKGLSVNAIICMATTMGLAYQTTYGESACVPAIFPYF